MSDPARDDVPDEERAVEAADGFLAGQGESLQALNGISEADADAPGLMGEATGVDRAE